ncbi:hypothetical protein [Prevotella dentasini]|nr:hypothetical protein [Prevotella dentasini]
MFTKSGWDVFRTATGSSLMTVVEDWKSGSFGEVCRQWYFDEVKTPL